MAALQHGQEELARQALMRRNQAQQEADQFQQQWEAQNQAVDALKQALRQLNDKIEEAKRKKTLLVARQKRAEAQRQIQETLRGIGDSSAFETFQRMEERVLQMEAEAEAAVDLTQELAGADLEQQFAALEGSDVDADLQELRARMGLEAATEGTSVDRSVEL